MASGAEEEVPRCVHDALAAIHSHSLENPVVVFPRPRDHGEPKNSMEGYCILERCSAETRRELLALSRENPGISRAVGALVGMAVGDSLGAPLEYLDVRDHNDDPSDSGWVCATCTFSNTSDSTSCAVCMIPRPLENIGGDSHNQFELKAGQWTDDTSMGLCLADSLLVKRRYDGSDARCRYYAWCYGAYNAAFRDDPGREYMLSANGPGETKHRNAVGCGQNMAKSIDDLVAGQVPPAVYESSSSDSGNGPLIRLAPVAICFHNMDVLLEAARQSSYATHPGPLAAEACAFWAFCIREALDRDGRPVTARAFAEHACERYREILAARCGVAGVDDAQRAAIQHLERLLDDTEFSTDSTEFAWNWRDEETHWKQTVKNRGSRYNGYPVTAGYIGSFALDGLAIALWAFCHSSSASDAISRCIGLRGDADSTGAITGQLAGAFYGHLSLGEESVRDVEKWDGGGEIAMRAALLWFMPEAAGTSTSCCRPT